MAANWWRRSLPAGFIPRPIQGSTWTPSAGPFSANWNSVASSADGARLVAVNSGGASLYFGEFGGTWDDQQSAAQQQLVCGPASSAMEPKLVVVAQKGLIYSRPIPGQLGI